MNISSTFPLVLALLLIWCSAYAIYYNFIRPVLLTRVRFRVNEIKDQLSFMQIAGKIKTDDEAISVVKKRAHYVECFMCHANVTTLLLAKSRGNLVPHKEVAAVEEMIGHASPDLRKISKRLDLTIAGAFAVNSPLLLGILVVVVSGLAMWFWMAQSFRKILTSSFWDTLYASHSNSSSWA